MSIFLSFIVNYYFFNFFLEVDLPSDLRSPARMLVRSYRLLLQVLAVAIWNWNVAALSASSILRAKVKAESAINFIFVPTICSFRYPSRSLIERANVYFLNCNSPEILLSMFRHFILYETEFFWRLIFLIFIFYWLISDWISS